MLVALLLLQSFLPGQGLSNQKSHGIVPKSQSKGVDFCGVGDAYYIIRSDLGCYMRSTNFNKGKDIHIFSLHNSVMGGDHYLSHKDGSFYIIKGNSYRRVSNLNTDEGADVYELHPNCRNGDFYYSSEDSFYIVFKKRGVYRRVTDLSKDSNAREFRIHPDLKEGLYYWGRKDYVYMVKPHDKWGLQYHRTTSLNTNGDPSTFSFHSDVVSFLPGGLSVNYGKSFGVWKVVKSIENFSSSNITWEQQVSKKVGYEKKKMDSVESNWHISSSVEVKTGGLAETFVQAQFSLGLEFGGAHVDTQEETWTEATKTSEKVSFTLLPKSRIYFWQYQLGFGQDEVLFCRDLAFTGSSEVPTYIPLPPPKVEEK